MVETESALAGKYLTFSLADELYGLEILRVQEIVGMLPVTRIPRLPAWVAGVVNLRGRIIPVVDIRSAFRMDAVAITDRTCIIVVRVVRDGGTSTVIGIVVDQVSDVIDLDAGSIEDAPEFGAGTDTSFIRGVGRIEAHVALLLDIDRVLSSSQLQEIDRAAHAAASGSDTEGES